MLLIKANPNGHESHDCAHDVTSHVVVKASSLPLPWKYLHYNVRKQAASLHENVQKQAGSLHSKRKGG